MISTYIGMVSPTSPCSCGVPTIGTYFNLSTSSSIVAGSRQKTSLTLAWVIPMYLSLFMSRSKKNHGQIRS